MHCDSYVNMIFREKIHEGQPLKLTISGALADHTKINDGFSCFSVQKMHSV